MENKQMSEIKLLNLQADVRDKAPESASRCQKSEEQSIVIDGDVVINGNLKITGKLIVLGTIEASDTITTYQEE